MSRGNKATRAKKSRDQELQDDKELAYFKHELMEKRAQQHVSTLPGDSDLQKELLACRAENELLKHELEKTNVYLAHEQRRNEQAYKWLGEQISKNNLQGQQHTKEHTRICWLGA